MPKKRRIQHVEIVQRFAQRLREVRRSSGMTQLELARRATVTDAYVGRLERGEAAPGIDLVERLAMALDTTVADLLPTTASPDTKGLLQDQAKRLTESFLQVADREALQMFDQLMALLTEALARTR